MINNAHKVTRALIALSFVIASMILVACTAVQPSSSDSKKQTALTVIDIVAKREWKPSEEGPLDCAADDPQSGELTYTWSAEKGSIKGQGKTVSWTAPDTLGDYSINVKVVSSKGGEVNFSKKLKVTDNPYHNQTADKTIYLNLTIPSANPVTQAGRLRTLTTAEIQCVVAGIDPAELTYTWTAATGKILAENLASGKASKVGWIAPGQGGSYTVSVLVTDKAGRQASGEVIFEILCCRDP